MTSAERTSAAHDPGPEPAPEEARAPAPERATAQAAASGEGAGPRRLLRLIDALCSAEEPAPLAELAATARLSKPTAHRLLRVLTADGWALALGDGRYGIGPAVRALGAAVAGSGSRASVERVIVELQREVRQTVHVGMRSGDRIVYTHKVEGDQPFAMTSRVGMQRPLHSTAIGKCILADLDKEDVAALARRAGLERYTPRTLATPAALHRELADVRGQGYAVDEEENEANVRCIAVPIRSADERVVGAVSVSTVTFLVDRGQVLELLPAVLAAAGRLQPILGS